MKLRQLDTTNKRDVKQFVDFPFELYRDHRYWVPPLYGEYKKVLDKEKHPFYEHSTADFFVVEQDGQLVGRIAALVNNNFNAYHKTEVAYFGYFECVEDRAVAQMLFEAAFDWARQHGLTKMLGPRGVMGVDGSVLVEGFDHLPALTVPYNYPYYDGLIKGAGFEKDTDLLSGYYSVYGYQLPERVPRLAAKMRKRRGFTIKKFESKREIREWIPRILAVHRESFSDLHSYYPPTEAEVRALVDTLLTIIDIGLIRLLMREEEIVGFILGYHNISAGIKRANGRLFPFGWYHILRDRRTTKTMNLNVLGFIPKYQGVGANVVLYEEIDNMVKSYGQFEHAEIVQIDEANSASKLDMEAMGTQWYKRHRYYKRPL